MHAKQSSASHTGLVRRQAAFTAGGPTTKRKTPATFSRIWGHIQHCPLPYDGRKYIRSLIVRIAP